jgi:hypothetical protein
MAAPRKNPPKDAVETIERLAALGCSIIGLSRAMGVSRETFKCWCEENEAIQDAFDAGRETLRQALIALIVQAATLNKGANSNAMFLLKTMFGFREFDSPNTKVDVAVAAPNVLVVVSHGTDEQWAAKVAAQQKALTADCTSPAKLEAPQGTQVDAVASFAPPSYLPPAYAPQAAPVAAAIPPAPIWDAPCWQAKA